MHEKGEKFAPSFVAPLGMCTHFFSRADSSDDFSAFPQSPLVLLLPGHDLPPQALLSVCPAAWWQASDLSPWVSPILCRTPWDSQAAPPHPRDPKRGGLLSFCFCSFSDCCPQGHLLGVFQNPGCCGGGAAMVQCHVRGSRPVLGSPSTMCVTLPQVL